MYIQHMVLIMHLRRLAADTIRLCLRVLLRCKNYLIQGGPVGMCHTS